METLTYPYRPQTKRLVFALAFFGLGTPVIAYDAMTNDRGLILDGLIHLSRDNATIFYWALAAACGLMTLVGVATLIRSALVTRTITLTATSLSSPRTIFSSGVFTVSFSDVQSLTVQQIRRQRFLAVRHRGGTLSIPALYLPDARVFEQFCAETELRVRAAAR